MLKEILKFVGTGVVQRDYVVTRKHTINNRDMQAYHVNMDGRVLM